MCVCRMVCVLLLDGCGVGQSWARLVVVGSWLLLVYNWLLVDWTCGGGKVGKDWLLLIPGCYFLFIGCWLIGLVEEAELGRIGYC